MSEKLLKRTMITLLSVSLFLSGSGYGQAFQSRDLPDPDSHWAYAFIQWGIENEILSGYADGTIRPDQSVKESEFLAMLIRYFDNTSQQLKKLNETSAVNHWTDHYYAIAKQYNIPLQGSTSLQAKELPVKRGNVAQMIAGSFGENYDVNGSIAFLYDQDLSNGKTSKTIKGYDSESSLTRAEAVAFLYRLHEKKANHTVLKTREKQQQHNIRAGYYAGTNKLLSSYIQTSGNIPISKYYEIFFVKETPYYRNTDDPKPLSTISAQTTPVPALARKGEWFSFALGNGQRWVKLSSKSIYVRSVVEKTGTDLEPKQNYMYLHHPVAIYEKATPHSKRLMYLDPQRVDVLKVNGNWYQVRTNIGSGWFYAGDYFATKSLGVQKILLHPNVSIYEYPSFYAKPIGVQTDVLQEVTAYASTKDWYQISENGSLYWAYAPGDRAQSIPSTFVKYSNTKGSIGNATFMTDDEIHEIQRRMVTDARGKQEKLFDTFIVRPVGYQGSKDQFYHHIKQEDGSRQALTDYLNQVFSKNNQLETLEAAADKVKHSFDEHNGKVNVIMGLPYLINQTNSIWSPKQLSDLEGWYIDEVIKRWNKMNPSSLNLLGFYWTHEIVPKQEVELIRRTSGWVHNKGYQFFWAPYFGATHAEKWKELGFDFAWLQPNYYFEGARIKHRGVDMIRESYSIAKATGSGTMLEFDWKLRNEQNYKLLDAYLTGGYQLGANKSSILVYDSQGAIDITFSSQDDGFEKIKEKFFNYLFD